MHPILASRNHLALYLAFWALIAILFAAAYASASPASFREAVLVGAPLVILYAFVSLSAFYVCRAAPLSIAGIRRVLISQFLSAGVAAGLWLLCWEGWTQFLQDYFSDSVVHYRDQVQLIAAAGVLLYGSAGMFHYLVIAFENSRSAIAHGLGLEVMAREAELKALRAQIDPHFLFNSLNSISALTTTDPEGARRMCILLADFFRNCVRLGNEDCVPLEQELEMVGNYLDIEKIRCGSKLQTRIDVDAGCEACYVPPLILQPLVENAVRHGIHARTTVGCVDIDARCDAGNLVLTIENPFEADAQRSKGTGVGLINVKQRIRTLFANKAGLTTSHDQDVFRLELRLPCLDSDGRVKL